ncbi:Homeobox-leucine zipper protein HAT22-like protein [Drosera capensis]
MVSDDDRGLALSLGFPSPTPFKHKQALETPISYDLSLCLSLSCDHDPKMLTKRDDAEADPSGSFGSGSGDRCSQVSVSVKRERGGEEAEEVERVWSPASEEREDDQDGGNRKKLRLSKEQSALLEESFKIHSTLNPKQKQALAQQLNLRPRQVEVWFQNRRARPVQTQISLIIIDCDFSDHNLDFYRTKLKQTELDCAFWKKCCEALTEENRKLHKELQELRALKSAQPPFYMQMPAATLTMCPSCERISASTTSSPPLIGYGGTKVSSFLQSPLHKPVRGLLV